jgi:hypothetical protein
VGAPATVRFAPRTTVEASFHLPGPFSPLPSRADMNLSGCQCEPADDPCHRLFTTVDDRGAFSLKDGVPELMQNWRVFPAVSSSYPTLLTVCSRRA